MDRASITNYLDKAVSLSFIVLLLLPLIVSLLQQKRLTSEVEMRRLAALPVGPTNVEALTHFPAALADYYSDHFGFREQLTKRYFKLIRKINRDRSVDDVTVGRDGWLFLGSVKSGYRRYRDPIGDAMHVNLYSESELAVFAESVSALSDWLNARGVAYVYVIAPNKHTIYFDKLPEYIEKQNPQSATDQLYRYLKKYTKVQVVDLRPALIAARKQHQLYYKSDTHWNSYGANIAQYEIMRQVKNLLPEAMSPKMLSENSFVVEPKKDGDLARMLASEEVVEEDPMPIFGSGCDPIAERILEKNTDTQIYHCTSGKLRAVIFRDSFFSALQPYIARYFERSTYIWQGANRKALEKYIAEEKPHIVIEETVERTLPYIHSVEREYQNEA